MKRSCSTPRVKRSRAFHFGGSTSPTTGPDGFWLVGYGIAKLNHEGKVLFQKPHEGWACVSVAVNPGDGSIWIVEHAHPNVAQSVNRLWYLDANGAKINSWDLRAKLIFGVACEPKTGTAWVVSLRSDVLRFTADGRELPPLPVQARAIAISPTTGEVWVTTDTEFLRLDASGQPKTSRFESNSGSPGWRHSESPAFTRESGLCAPGKYRLPGS